MQIEEIVINGTAALGAGLITTAAYLSALASAGIVADLVNFKNRIKSEDDLRTVVYEEAAKLGIDYSIIDQVRHTRGSDGHILGMVSQKSNGKWDVLIPGGIFCSKNIVRHELSHIKNDECKYQRKGIIPGLLHYFFLGEPRAVLYGALGIGQNKSS
jgi:hypothetical protein